VKRVLFDENMPRKLRRDLPGLEIRTVQEEGWGGLENGHLLRRASLTFDILLTADQRMRYQQSVSQLGLAPADRLFRQLERRDGLFASHGWEGIKEQIRRIARFQVIE
jgi:hypothetical protein